MTVSPRSLSGGDVKGEARRYAPVQAEAHPTPEASRLSGFPLRGLTTKHKNEAAKQAQGGERGLIYSLRLIRINANIILRDDF
jgi:hypothetical protein